MMAVRGKHGGDPFFIVGRRFFAVGQVGKDCLVMLSGEFDQFSVYSGGVAGVPVDQVDNGIDDGQFVLVMENSLPGRVAAVDIFPERDIGSYGRINREKLRGLSRKGAAKKHDEERQQCAQPGGYAKSGGMS
jgi:hypothetical protein